MITLAFEQIHSVLHYGPTELISEVLHLLKIPQAFLSSVDALDIENIWVHLRLLN